MASSIDATKPTAGAALTADVRNNFSAAKTEIEALQADLTAGLATKLNLTGGTLSGWLKMAVGSGHYLYNLDTDASNYERLSIGWASNTLKINAEAAGTGTQRHIGLQTAGGSIGLRTAAPLAELHLLGAGGVIVDRSRPVVGSGLTSNFLIEDATRAWLELATNPSGASGIVFNSSSWDGRACGIRRIQSTEHMAFFSGDFTDRMYLVGPNLGIGVYPPTERLHIDGNIKSTGYQSTTPVTVATLPAAATAGAGARHFVTDSTVAASGNFGAAVTGGGSNIVPVYSDGTSWRIG